MMAWYLIENGVVLGRDCNPRDSWVEGPEGLPPGTLHDGEEFSAPPSPSISGNTVNAERDRRIRAGKTFAVSGYGDIPIDGLPTTQLNLLALKDTARDLKDAGIAAAVIPYRDTENVTHMLTADQVIELVNMGKQHVQAIYSASWALKAQAPIPAEYDVDIHWP